MESVGSKPLTEPESLALLNSAKSFMVAKYTATGLLEATASSKFNGVVQGMLVLKVKWKSNISSDFSDEDTTTDDYSVEAMLLTNLNILLTNPEEKCGVYPLGIITKEDIATCSAFKTNTHDHIYDDIEYLHHSFQYLHLNYFHSNMNNLFAMPLNCFLLMIYLSKEKFQEEL